MSELIVERYRERVIEHEQGYLPVCKIIDKQRLVRIHKNFFGTFRQILDTEVIPEHVVICLGTVGDNGGWRSKFAAYIK